MFLNQSLAELNLTYLEDLIIEKEELEEMLVEGIGEPKEIRHRLIVINKALDNGEGDQMSDDLIDEWERKLEAGEEVDLNEGLKRGQ